MESIDSIHLDEDLVDVFDMIHMSIFIITLLYATFTGMILYLSTRISAKWKYLEDIDTYNYDSLIKQCDAVNEQLGLGFDAVCAGWCGFLFSVEVTCVMWCILFSFRLYENMQNDCSLVPLQV